VACRKADYCTHRLADRVERVDFVQSVFRNFASHSVIVFTEIKHKPEQSAFCLVAKLFRRISTFISRLSMTQQVVAGSSCYSHTTLSTK